MYDLAHACLCCRTITIFSEHAPFPRRCGTCDAIVRASAHTPFIARPAIDDDDDFLLELGPEPTYAAPF